MNRAVQALYDRSPVAVQNGLLSIYGFYLRRLRYGARHRAFLEELRASERLGADELAARQSRAVVAMVEHARRTVPFYAQLPALASGDLAALRELPFVTKDQLQAAGDRTVSTKYAGRPLKEIHTGGTTGKPLNIRCTPEALQRNYAFFSRFRSWTGFIDGDRTATFAGRNIIPPRLAQSGTYWRHNLAARTLLLSSYHLGASSVAGYARALERFAPALIDSYPSSLAPIVDHLLASGIAIRPKGVITSSETLDPAARERIERAFACRVFDHYGAAEMAAFITQCEHGAYHVNPEFGVVEILDEAGRPAAPGETGEIVATGLVNDAMPLIRYRTGDQAVQGRDGCPCGRAFPIVERIIGRMDDVVITPEGWRVGRLDPVFKVIKGLYETRIVQDKRDHVRVEVVTTSEYVEADGGILRAELQRRLGPSMRIDLVRVPSIERAASGKLRTVVNLVDRRAADGGA